MKIFQTQNGNLLLIDTARKLNVQISKQTGSLTFVGELVTNDEQDISIKEFTSYGLQETALPTSLMKDIDAILTKLVTVASNI